MTEPLRSLEITVEAPRAAAPRPGQLILDDEPAGRGWAPVRPRTAAAAGVVVLVGLAAFAIGNRGDVSPAPVDKEAVSSLIDARLDKTGHDLARAPAVASEVYRTISPSIVVIRATGSGGEDDSGLGSGVIINADGSVLTALHVVEGSVGLRVTFADGTETAARITSADRSNDTAVLLPDSKPALIVPAVLGGGVRVGDEAFAVGHPLGLFDSLSSGVISGLNRSIPREDNGRLDGLIQFDAAVNPGNSGGPLLDRAGRVVGIVTAIADPSKDKSFIGIGFAVPIAAAGGAARAPSR